MNVDDIMDNTCDGILKRLRTTLKLMLRIRKKERSQISGSHNEERRLGVINTHRGYSSQNK